MAATQPKKKKQHYVPQCYLEAWAMPETHQINVYDKELRKSRVSNIIDVASENYFYDINFDKALTNEERLQIGLWNMIVCRTFLANTIPEELFEAAAIDGAGYVRYMLVIALPLSKAIIATLILWYAIAHWNAYFGALIYINKKALKPFSLYLREYLVQQNTMDIAELTAGEEVRMDLMGITELMKNSLTLLSCLPLWILYPFVQKYLVQGVMIGSVKG